MSLNPSFFHFANNNSFRQNLAQDEITDGSFCFFAWAWFCPCRQWAADTNTTPARLDRNQLLIYHDDHHGVPQTVKSVRDWEKRRAEIVRGMESHDGGRCPGREKRCALDVKV